MKEDCCTSLINLSSRLNTNYVAIAILRGNTIISMLGLLLSKFEEQSNLDLRLHAVSVWEANLVANMQFRRKMTTQL